MTLQLPSELPSSTKITSQWEARFVACAAIPRKRVSNVASSSLTGTTNESDGRAWVSTVRTMFVMLPNSLCESACLHCEHLADPPELPPSETRVALYQTSSNADSFRSTKPNSRKNSRGR